MKHTVKDWGKLSDGSTAHLITLDNESGITISVSDYGATFQAITVEDSNQIPKDILLGYDNLEDYINDTQNFGGTIGRFANRIAGACITLAGKDWPITANEGANTLHGGVGFNKALWNYQLTDNSLILTLRSPHLDNGFPGNLTVTQTLSFSGSKSILVEYSASTDTQTVCGLTNHSYFNFSGTESVKDYIVKINADHYTPTDNAGIPTGEILPVAGTRFDYTIPKPVTSECANDNYVLNSNPNNDVCVEVTDPASNFKMQMKTDFPGLQLYNGFYIGKCIGKGNSPYDDLRGICFEPQYFPDSMHHDNFPSPIINPDETQRHFIEYIF